MLELKRGDRARVRKEMVEFIACRSRSQVKVKLAISRRTCAGMTKKCTKKRDARAKLLFCSLNLLFF